MMLRVSTGAIPFVRSILFKYVLAGSGLAGIRFGLMARVDSY